MAVLTAERIDVIECPVPGDCTERAAPGPGGMRFGTSRAVDLIDADLPEDHDLDDGEPADEDAVEAEAVA